VSIAAATSIAAACKGDASLANGCHHTRGDRLRDCRAGDRLVYSPYTTTHQRATAGGTNQRTLCWYCHWVGWPAAVSVCTAARGAKQSGPTERSPTMVAEATVQAEHRLNLSRSRETDRENSYENRLPVFSYERSPIVMHNILCMWSLLCGMILLRIESVPTLEEEVEGRMCHVPQNLQYIGVIRPNSMVSYRPIA